MRSKMTKAEEVLWLKLRKNQINDLKKISNFKNPI
ncbi:MAG: hypothetical protein ACUVTX_11315, partial [Bacteroidales bacterium]